MGCKVRIEFFILNSNIPSFFKHFSKANAYLKSAGLAEIDWSKLPSEDEMPLD
jgi:hypothetical protein